MFLSQYIPLKRKSFDILLVGNKSYGKTLTMTAIGEQAKNQNYIVFSNYPLAYPHILIDTLRGFDLIGQYPQNQKKIILMEDFEKWVHSRNAQEKQNLDIVTICADNGKNNASLVSTTKRPMAIDISVRDTTDIVIEASLIMPYLLNTGHPELDTAIMKFWATDFSKLFVKLKCFDSNLNYLGTKYLTDLVRIGQLYDTQGIITTLKKT